MRYSKQQCDEMLQKIKSHQMSIYEIPENDEDVYDTFKRGESVFTFQFGSNLSRGILKQMKNLNSVYDLASITALGRPGPMKEIPRFVRLANGEPTEEDLQNKMPKQFEPYFKNSYGIFVFQEQFIEVCRHVAGFNWSEADEARKAVGKKNLAFIEAIRERFFNGCMKAGVSKEDLDKFWEGLLDFASYAFNLSHAYCYAELGYITCWFLTHYPAEYLSSVMNKFSGDKEKLSEAIKYAKLRGIKVLPPSLNHSQSGFAPDKDGNIYYGFSAIKGIGKTGDLLVERRKNRIIRTVKDFFDIYSDISSSKMKALAEAGVFDEVLKTDPLIKKRYILLYNWDEIYKTYKPGKVNIKQTTLFDITPQLDIVEPPDKATMFIKSLFKEKELLGDFVSANPLGFTKMKTDTNVSELMHNPSLIKDKVNIVIVGIVQKIRKIHTKKGDLMAFLTLEGEEGEFDCTVFPKLFSEVSLQEGIVIGIEGTMTQYKDGYSLVANKITQQLITT